MNANMVVDVRSNGRAKKQRKAAPDPHNALWGAYVKQRSVAARNALIEAYLPLVQNEAHKVSALLSYAVTAQELESAGTLGLINCIESFDTSQGIKFITFCTPRIRGAMIDELRSWDWTPRAMRAKLNRMARVISQVEARLGRAPDEDELALEMGTTQDEIRQLVFAKQRSLFSLDGAWGKHDRSEGESPAAVLEDRSDNDPLRNLQKKEVTEVVRKMLDKTELLVITLYYYEQLNLREIGELLSLTESRICQIHTKVVQRLKKKLA
jgi:RNA polymerase sigma factor FliA